jgi:hypothetical protein
LGMVLPLAGNGRGGSGRLAEPLLIEIGRLLRFRQAIKTAKVATVRHADAQIPEDAAMRID